MKQRIYSGLSVVLSFLSFTACNQNYGALIEDDATSIQTTRTAANFPVSEPAQVQAAPILDPTLSEHPVPSALNEANEPVKKGSHSLDDENPPIADENKCGENHEKVLICHIPFGNSADPNTLCVELKSAMHGHEVNMDGSVGKTGDYLGECIGE